jgi:competence protein ComEA
MLPFLRYLKDRPLVLAGFGVLLSMSLVSLLTAYLVLKLSGYTFDGVVLSGTDSHVLIEKSDAGDKSENNPAIKVDVSGAVRLPGVVEVSGDARVGDVIERAGGLTSESSGRYVAQYLNLAAVVQDGMKIYVPFDWDFLPEDTGLAASQYGWLENTPISQITPVISGPSTTSNVIQIPDNNASNSMKINVNTASLQELDALPGIGPAYAQRIVENRPHKDIQGMKESTKIPQSTLDKLADLVTF